VTAIRELVLRQFPRGIRAREPNDDLEDALYFMLRLVDVGVTVDGWTVFRVVQETDDSLEAIGLMTLLPSGSVPIAVNVTRHQDGIAWSAQVGREDYEWLALSESKRWKTIYLYASCDLQEPRWTWNLTRQGVYAGRELAACGAKPEP
jgi:hypothetical protein